MEREAIYPKLLEYVSGPYVEIGTCWGGFAEFLLTHTPCSGLFCVDPYKTFPDPMYHDALNAIPQADLDKKFTIVSKRLRENKLGKPVQMIRLSSYEAAKLLPDGLSFVYIDGNHHHREVLKDLVVWWPKLAVGGFLCGDDVEDLQTPHQEGDLFVEHQPGSYGVYGIATALQDFQKVVPGFQYSLKGNQFIAQKKY